MESIFQKIGLIYEDDEVIVIDKPAGLTVHPTKPRTLGKSRPADSSPTLVDWLVARWPTIGQVGDEPRLRPGLVHRLDRDTSGVLIVAKTQRSFNFLKRQFKKRQVKKEYLALVYGIPKQAQASIERPIGRAGARGIKRRTFQKIEKNNRPARTEYQIQKRFEHFSLLKVIPITGRTHQIRVHLSSIGHPIVGDELYGQWKNQPRLPGLDRPFLHAFALEITLPSGKVSRFESPLPPSLKQILARLKQEQKGQVLLKDH